MIMMSTVVLDHKFVINVMSVWFAVMFWFSLLGVAGALLYRLSHIIAMSDESSSNIKNPKCPNR